MAFSISPAVEVTEKDLTLGVRGTATTKAGGVIMANWGPVGERVLVSSESELVSVFGEPSTLNAPYWFQLANFLAYSNGAEVVRATNGADNATDTGVGVVIKNKDDYESLIAGATLDSYRFIAKYPGSLGNSVGVEVITQTSFNTAAFKDAFDAAPVDADGEFHIAVYDLNGDWTGTAGTLLEKFANVALSAGALKEDGSSNYWRDIVNDGSQYVWVGGATTAGTEPLTFNFGSTFTAVFGTDTVITDTAPVAGLLSTDTLVSVTLNYGASSVTYTSGVTITGNNELTFAGVDVSAGLIGVTVNVTRGALVDFDLTNIDGDFELSGGSDDTGAATLGSLQLALDLFANAEEVDVSIIVTPASTSLSDATSLTNYVAAIAETRADAVGTASPYLGAVVGVVNDTTRSSLVKAWADTINSSSYMFLTNNWKYQYDKYNDTYRWVPDSGDIAGLIARTESVAEAWFSPAGYNRGFIRNVTKLAWSPNKTFRDELYKARVNSVISEKGQGTLLLGDKTALSKPSAFDRINVRRLFIVLEKSIATAAKYQLFEFNDQFSRAQFVSYVEPFLRDVQGRRGIYDFRVVCDSTNNTGEVIDRNEFVGDIYLKPAKSINFIKLNFVAVRTGVSFEEVIGG